MLDQTTSNASQGTAAAHKQPTPQRPAAVQPQASLTESADQAVKSVATLYSAVDGVLARQVQDSPYTTLAAAAAVGFVLGGGMRSPIGQLLLRLSVRTFGPPLVNAALQSVIEKTSAGIGAGK